MWGGGILRCRGEGILRCRGGGSRGVGWDPTVGGGSPNALHPRCRGGGESRGVGWDPSVGGGSPNALHPRCKGGGSRSVGWGGSCGVGGGDPAVSRGKIPRCRERGDPAV